MKHVLLALNWYQPAVHEGVVAYASERGWLLNEDLVRRSGRFRNGGWTGDGIIANSGGNRRYMEQLISFGCPIVTVNTTAPNPEFCSVSTDNSKVVELAFDYFRRKGFQNFAACGSSFAGILMNFRTLVESNGFSCDVLTWDLHSKVLQFNDITDWLRSRSFPTAVFCNCDDQAKTLIQLAVEADINVPHDVAVMGVENWELACNSAPVAITSVDNNLFEVGYQVAAKLDQIMAGGPEPSRQTLIGPKGIVERASTDTIGATSPYVRQAIAIMERDYEKGLSINDVVGDLGISLSSLEKAFRSELGYTPVVALRNVRMKAAAQLLTVTDEKIESISRMVGVNNKHYFQTLFKKHFCTTPRKYRVQAREG